MSVAAAVEAIVGACDPRKMVLFGSVARGQARLGSDIDLLAVIDHDADWEAAGKAALLSVARLEPEVDTDVAHRVKELAGRRGVSTFADRALRHKVARADLRTLLDEIEAELGPADPTMVVEAEAMLASLEQRARRTPERRAAG